MKVWISAGEVSGDRLGALLARELFRLRPDLEIAGIAGPLMRGAGVQGRADALRFAHAGWSSVLRDLPGLAKAVWGGERALDRFAPDLVVAIDAPGLNRRMVRRARAAGSKVAWLAPPQLWAWRARRVPELDGLDVYPLHAFEREDLERAGARPRWHGFPGPRPWEGRASGGTHLVLLPGSRPSWRRRHEALFRMAAEQASLGLGIAVAVPEGHPCQEGELPVDQALDRAALVLAMPGTGVLEAACRGVPAVVAAHPGWLDRAMASRRVAKGALSLPNRILGESVLPEHLGTPGAPELAQALRALWCRRREVSRRLENLAEAMGDGGAMGRIALDLVEHGRAEAKWSGSSGAGLSYLSNVRRTLSSQGDGRKLEMCMADA